MALKPELEAWANAAKGYFANGGANPKFALQIARLYIGLWDAGLQPRVSSLYRDPSHNKALQARYDSGDRAGFNARPATNSKHSTQDWLGRPSAEAIDMPSNDPVRAAKIARELGIGAGLGFSQPDPHHYYLL